VIGIFFFWTSPPTSISGPSKIREKSAAAGALCGYGVSVSYYSMFSRVSRFRVHPSSVPAALLRERFANKRNPVTFGRHGETRGEPTRTANGLTALLLAWRVVVGARSSELAVFVDLFPAVETAKTLAGTTRAVSWPYPSQGPPPLLESRPSDRNNAQLVPVTYSRVSLGPPVITCSPESKLERRYRGRGTKEPNDPLDIFDGFVPASRVAEHLSTCVLVSKRYSSKRRTIRPNTPHA